MMKKWLDRIISIFVKRQKKVYVLEQEDFKESDYVVEKEVEDKNTKRLLYLSNRVRKPRVKKKLEKRLWKIKHESERF